MFTYQMPQRIAVDIYHVCSNVATKLHDQLSSQWPYMTQFMPIMEGCLGYSVSVRVRVRVRVSKDFYFGGQNILEVCLVSTFEFGGLFLFFFFARKQRMTKKKKLALPPPRLTGASPPPPTPPHPTLYSALNFCPRRDRTVCLNPADHAPETTAPYAFVKFTVVPHHIINILSTTKSTAPHSFTSTQKEEKKNKTKLLKQKSLQKQTLY